MELHEFHVGDASARSIRERNSIAGRHLRVRGFLEYLAGAAGRQERRAPGRDAHGSALVEEPHASTPAVFDNGAHGERVLQHADMARRRNALPQDASDLAPGCICCVEHPPHTVRAFRSEGRPAVCVAIELRTPFDQLARVTRSFLAQYVDGTVVTQTVSSRHRVARVKRGSVVRTDGSRNAALSVLGVAFVGIGFRDDDDVARRRQFNRRAEPGDSAADDYEVAAYIHRVLSYRGFGEGRYLPDLAQDVAAGGFVDVHVGAGTHGSNRIQVLRVDVETGSQKYPIFIEQGLTSQLGRLIESSPKPASRQFFVSSPLVWKLHGKTLAKAVPKTETILLPDGEKFKQLATASRAYESLIKLDADRGAGIIAVGGGVIGDMAGFVAATYLRGITLIQVPTTLLAQVDSAIGGKVGVNHALGKNLIGAFHQPSLVVVDPAFLETLPRREFRAGLYEVIKYGMTSSRDLFDRIDREIDAIFARKGEALVPIIAESCTIKAQVVSRDERESGPRRMLNFGHTTGHALEAVTKYKRFRHGEAIAYGMLVAAEIAVARGMMPMTDREALGKIIIKLGPLPPVGDLSIKEVMEAIKHDKKVVNGTLHYVLSTGIGSWSTATDVTEDELTKALKKVGLKK
jgi:3-dehydroquinate synthase